MPTETLMRRILPIVILMMLALWLVSALGGGPNADTPVLVLAADDPILRLPVSPGVDRIVSDLRIELQRLAAVETDARIAEALLGLSDDDDLLRSIATAPVDMFASGDAAATATAVYDITLGPDLVTVIVTTVELVPGYGATAVSREHEDGHALINRSVAQRCAAEALAAGVNSGRRGASLIDGMMAYMTDAADSVHTVYHRYVTGAPFGRHIRLAEQALAEVLPCA